ncbi:hypothetical protein [Glutamicibacter halophytocola]|nr:hypothetical protein [Glutamicibacter halophytocola]
MHQQNNASPQIRTESDFVDATVQVAFGFEGLFAVHQATAKS